MIINTQTLYVNLLSVDVLHVQMNNTVVLTLYCLVGLAPLGSSSMREYSVLKSTCLLRPFVYFHLVM